MLPSSATRRYRRLIAVLFVATVALAAALRLIGLGFGRCVLTARPDEELIRSAVLTTMTGDLNPHYAVWGHLFHYAYSGAAAAWLGVQVWAGHAASWVDAVAAAHCEPWDLIWIGRALSAIAGTLTLIPTYHLARRSSGRHLTAISACLLLSVLFLHVRDSHFATTDILLTLNATAALAAAAHPGPLRPVWAGIWSGLALASKLTAITVALTVATLVLLERRPAEERSNWRMRLRTLLKYLAATACVAVATQPFLLLDPLETWHGMFGELFTPGRRPFEAGLSLRDTSILVRYFVPQAMGWAIGLLAVCGGALLLRRLRTRPRVTPVVYAIWSILSLVSVQGIFLRYVDALLPVVCVLAAHTIELAVRWFTGHVRALHGRRLAQCRFGLTLAATAILALPNLVRDVWFDHRLLQTDTRALASRWIEENVPPGNRVLWAGYGTMAPHLTMPWLHTPPDHDAAHVALRAARGLPTAVDEAIAKWKSDRAVPTYQVVQIVFGSDEPERSGIDAFPYLDHESGPSWLLHVDRWVRERGLVRGESPRWDLMRRHITAVRAVSPESLLAGDEQYLVVTGMPCDEGLLRRLGTQFDEVQTFLPEVPWQEYGGRVLYDTGDAWYLPNLGIHRVARPGPEIRILRRK